MLFIVLILVATLLIFIMVYKRDVNYNYGGNYSQPQPPQQHHLLPPGQPEAPAAAFDMNDVLYPKKKDDSPSA
jgi:hypothetical protein